MVEVYKCPKCIGDGCPYCGNLGYITLVEKSLEKQTLNKKLMRFFEEPHDFIWASKKLV